MNALFFLVTVCVHAHVHATGRVCALGTCFHCRSTVEGPKNAAGMAEIP